MLHTLNKWMCCLLKDIRKNHGSWLFPFFKFLFHFYYVCFESNVRFHYFILSVWFKNACHKGTCWPTITCCISNDEVSKTVAQEPSYTHITARLYTHYDLQLSCKWADSVVIVAGFLSTTMTDPTEFDLSSFAGVLSLHIIPLTPLEIQHTDVCGQ